VMVTQTDIEVAVSSSPADEVSACESAMTTFILSGNRVQVIGPEDLASQTKAAFEPSFSEMGLLPTYQRLGQLTALEPNWDSYGAAPVSEGAILAAHEFLSFMSERLLGAVDLQISPYTVAPLSDGGVQFEWRGHRSALELEIEPSGALSSLLVRDDESGRTYEEHANVSSREAVEMIAQTLQS